MMKPLHLALALHVCQSCFGGAAQAQPPMVSGVDRANFDAQVKPQADLYQAANGRWLKEAAIPADKSAYGVFIELRDRADGRVRKIVEELAASSHPAGSLQQKMADFYRGHLDEAAIDKAGSAPLAPWLAQIDEVKTAAGLARLLGQWQGIVATPLPVWVDADPKEPDTNRALLWQGGLGLPDRDYYLGEEARFTQARAAYLVYLETLFRLGGDAQPARSAASVLALERQIAQAQWAKVDTRDALKTYNPMTVAELAQAAPGFDWPVFFGAAALPSIDRLSVSQPSYVTALAALTASVPLADWRLYLRMRLLDARAELLPQAFREAHFAFHGKALAGQMEPQPRWQFATKMLNDALGEGVGQLYVARYFPPAYKERMQVLVSRLLTAYDQSIAALTWMGPVTKQRAKEKLAKYRTKIGYPDRWRDYSALSVRAGDALGNQARAGRFEYERLARQAGQPVDKAEWGMTPQTVNAYYNPGGNEIVFPAAILEPPFFDMGADDAANYGAIGAVIGHEISHGFDDQGSQYDGDGKLANWWTPEDRKAFDALTSQLVAQYNAYEPVPGHAVNGRLTLGENIADLSGLQVAYKAYHLALGGKPAEVIDGFTGDQRFFLGWSQAWRMKVRDERALQLLTIDPHSPTQFRANGAAVNHDGFHASFGTRPGDGMYKPSESRIRIW
ncbi:MAG TPA: M13 family metallopeptidase [Ideonella sp.]|nr:M13 family metallopeptidase [Ideonella sp.]